MYSVNRAVDFIVELLLDAFLLVYMGMRFYVPLLQMLWSFTIAV